MSASYRRNPARRVPETWASEPTRGRAAGGGALLRSCCAPRFRETTWGSLRRTRDVATPSAAPAASQGLGEAFGFGPQARAGQRPALLRLRWPWGQEVRGGTRGRRRARRAPGRPCLGARSLGRGAPRPSPWATGAGLASGGAEGRAREHHSRPGRRRRGGARTRGLQPSRTPAARHLSPSLALLGLINWRFHLAPVSVCPLWKAKTRRPAPGAGPAGTTSPAGGGRGAREGGSVLRGRKIPSP